MLIGLIGGMSVLAIILVGFAIYKIAFHSRPAQAPAIEMAIPAPDITLPARSLIQSIQVAGDRLIVSLRTDRGDEIDIVDTKTGRLVSRIVTAQPGAMPSPQ